MSAGRPGSFGDAFGPFGPDDAARMFERRKRLEDIHSVADSLRTPMDAPDLTDAILDKVGESKPFLSTSGQRMVVAGRVGLAASVAVAILGVVLLHRSAGRDLELAQTPAPLSDVVASTTDAAITARIEATRGLETVRSSVANFCTAVRSTPDEPAPAVCTRAQRPSLAKTISASRAGWVEYPVSGQYKVSQAVWAWSYSTIDDRAAAVEGTRDLDDGLPTYIGRDSSRPAVPR